MEYSTTLLVNPLTLEPSADTNNTSDSLFFDGGSSVLGAVEAETFPLSSSSTTTVSDNNAQFGNGKMRNGRPFKWTMDLAPNLEVKLRKSIKKAKSCREQREKVKRLYLQLKEVIKQKDGIINHLLGRKTQLEGENGKLSSANMLLMENEREGSSNNNHDDRSNGLLDGVFTGSFDMESLY